MHSDELRKAVTLIVDVLKRTGIKTAIDQYRIAKGDQRTVAAAELGDAGATLVERFDTLSQDGRKVLKCLHLETLGSAQYWDKLMSGDMDSVEHKAEVVRLASRVVFAISHLPAMVSLLGDVKQAVAAPAAAAPAAPAAASVSPLLGPVEAGEGALFVRLTDAGERASDPDRIARAIDGVDMLYSACASIARKPAIDLRLDHVAAKQNRDRDFRFTGDRDSISAVFAVIDSIPGALADIDPEQDIDLDEVVRSLPIFRDLNTLASLGTFSAKDLQDISETMHQGSLLILEGGVILIDEQMVTQGQLQAGEAAQQAAASQHVAHANVSAPTANVASAPAPGIPAAAATPTAPVAPAQSGASASAAESDEHYNRYLQEREAMIKTQTLSVPDQTPVGSKGMSAGQSILPQAETEADDSTRRGAVENLLKSLGQSKTT